MAKDHRQVQVAVWQLTFGDFLTLLICFLVAAIANAPLNLQQNQPPPSERGEQAAAPAGAAAGTHIADQCVDGCGGAERHLRLGVRRIAASDRQLGTARRLVKFLTGGPDTVPTRLTVVISGAASSGNVTRRSLRAVTVLAARANAVVSRVEFRAPRSARDRARIDLRARA